LRCLHCADGEFAPRLRIGTPRLALPKTPQPQQVQLTDHRQPLPAAGSQHAPPPEDTCLYTGAVATSFADIAKAQYVLLTTFTKDGQPKRKPIWAANDGDRLLVITQSKSWKVKRIRSTPRVTLAICDMRGNPKSEPIDATATILDPSQTGLVYDAIGNEYGIVGRVF